MLSAFTDRDYPFGDSCHNEVGHITCIQLVHQMTAVRINRIGRDTKFLSYFLRVLALGYPFQYIKFAQGQFLTPPFVRTPHLCTHMLGIRAIVTSAIQHPANGFGYFRRIDGFKLDTVYCTLNQIFDKPDFFVHGVDNDACPRVFLPYPHNDVHPGYVG